MNTRPALLLVLSILATTATAQSDWVDRVIGAYRTPAPITTAPLPDARLAIDIQNRVVAALVPEFGAVLGYKAGLTSPAARERFGVNEPILGTLLDGMLLENGATISVSDGVHLLVEADLLVRVRDARINQAGSRAEAFASIDRVAPFIEVPDVIIQPGQPVNGAVLTAVNSGARWGVIGAAIDTDKILIADLAAFAVRLEGGDAVNESNGEALMGHPLEVVLWIAGEVRKRGNKLKAGDWLSLGSLTAPVPVRAGQSYRATYSGLGPDAATVTVHFIP